MAFEHKEGQGTLFKNDKQNERQPDFKGTINIGGVTYEIAAWEKTSQRGGSFLSLQASLPRERGEASPTASSLQRPEPAYQPSAPTFQQEAPMPSEEPFFGNSDDEDLPF